ncbi:MAG: hypothetical protein XD77_0257 [Marinimicrobia bacterium 46_47]|nr:MAG: hypothetical protein XD77_0257 [Marinimicrobia bacterium 46_47]KUK91764.1 MAG: hypothetical protein XE04_0836 [Marinimicrobia bacterium 46_43]
MIFLIIVLFLLPAKLFPQRIYAFEQFLQNVRIKREKDLQSLGCYKFTFLREQIIREDTLSTLLTFRGQEYHNKNQPIVRMYETLLINGSPVDTLLKADTLLSRENIPDFYDENFYRYYMIRDLGKASLNNTDMRLLEFIPRGETSGLMKGMAWIDPKTYGIIKMALEPHPLPEGLTKMEIEIFNTYDEKGRIIRFGMQSLSHIITVDKQMEIRIRERYSQYENYPDSLCDSLNTHYSLQP